MPIPTTISDLSTTAASNYPAGSDSPSVLDDVQRAHAAFIAGLRDDPTANALAAIPVAKGGTGASTAPLARAALGAAASGSNSDITSWSGGPLAGFRNRIINGDMRINKRGIAGTLPSTVAYSLDRWIVSSAGAAPSAQQSTTSSAGNQLSNTLAVTGVAGNTGVNIRHRIEAANCRDMAGQTVTLSWWAYQNTGSAMNVTCSLSYATATDNFTSVTFIATSSATSVPSGGNFTRITATFSVPAAATTGLEVVLFANTPTILGGQVLGVANVQLELGSVATTFEQRPYGMELALCQRYYQVPTVGWIGAGVSTSPFGGLINISPMRVTPTVAFAADLSVNGFPAGALTLGATSPTSVQYSKVASSSAQGVYYYATFSASAEL